MKGRTLIVEFHPWERPNRSRTAESRRIALGFVTVEWCLGRWSYRVRRLTDELARLQAIIRERLGLKP